jgi:hypothetical protein
VKDLQRATILPESKVEEERQKEEVPKWMSSENEGNSTERDRSTVRLQAAKTVIAGAEDEARQTVIVLRHGRVGEAVS